MESQFTEHRASDGFSFPFSFFFESMKVSPFKVTQSDLSLQQSQDKQFIQETNNVWGLLGP